MCFTENCIFQTKLKFHNDYEKIWCIAIYHLTETDIDSSNIVPSIEEECATIEKDGFDSHFNNQGLNCNLSVSVLPVSSNDLI
jgi:hypothetical protein